MYLKKCDACKTYMLQETCMKCNKQTTSPVYTFKRLRDAPKDSSNHFSRLRKKQR